MSRTKRLAVADTNVVISSFLAPQSSVSKALFLLAQSHELLVSFETLTELRLVWSRSKFDRIASPERRAQVLSRFETKLRLIQPHVFIQACRDPRDDKFLELAVSGGAELILTGDADLLALHPFRGISILTPADYLASVAAEG